MDGLHPNTLPKKERLCGKTGIEKLLARGRHGNMSELRYIFLSGTEMPYNRILVSVPKKLFKRAVKRNLLKRRIRECWRKQKHSLNAQAGIDILFIYSTKEILTYQDIYVRVGQIIEKINERVAKQDSAHS